MYTECLQPISSAHQAADPSAGSATGVDTFSIIGTGAAAAFSGDFIGSGVLFRELAGPGAAGAGAGPIDISSPFCSFASFLSACFFFLAIAEAASTSAFSLATLRSPATSSASEGPVAASLRTFRCASIAVL